VNGEARGFVVEFAPRYPARRLILSGKIETKMAEAADLTHLASGSGLAA
jgi:hypothetical protein